MAAFKEKPNYNLTLEAVEMPRPFRNFAGNPGPFNAPGARNFCILLDEADMLKVDPNYWNVKMLKPREEGDEPRPYLQIAIRWPRPTDKFQGQPPLVVMITDKYVTNDAGEQKIVKARTTLDESMVSLLDWAQVTNVDVMIRPNEYDFQGRKGVKAYCKALYVTIESDELAMKYADIPENTNNGMVFEYDEDEEA